MKNFIEPPLNLCCVWKGISQIDGYKQKVLKHNSNCLFVCVFTYVNNWFNGLLIWFVENDSSLLFVIWTFELNIIVNSR